MALVSFPGSMREVLGGWLCQVYREMSGAICEESAGRSLGFETLTPWTPDSKPKAGI